MAGRPDLRKYEGSLVPLFGAGGWAIAETASDRGTSKWAIWAAIVVVMTTAAGAVFVYGVRRWRELQARSALGFWAVAPRIAVFYLVAAVGAAVYEVIFLPAVGRVDWRGGLLVTIVGVGVLPALAVIEAISRLAAVQLTDMHAAEMEGIVWSRRLLQRLLAPLGGLIALLVAAQALGTARFEDPSPAVTLMFGGFASTLLAITYAPAAARLRERALALIEALLPSGAANGAALVEIADKRAKAAGLLGADKSVFGDLQTNVAVIGPLIASAAAAFLP